jgi:hypothetical protein
VLVVSSTFFSGDKVTSEGILPKLLGASLHDLYICQARVPGAHKIADAIAKTHAQTWYRRGGPAAVRLA